MVRRRAARLAPVSLTSRRLNRATLARQLLLRREPLPVAEAVRRIVAIQAQEPASPYVAVWNRVAGFDPAELDGALAAFDVVKATLMRITLHAVHADDHPTFRAAMQPTLRAARLHDRRFTGTGLTIADADILVPRVVELAAAPVTNAEMEAALAELVDAASAPWVWWALRCVAPVVHAPTGGPWSFGRRPAYVAAPTPPAAEDAAGSLERLIVRYLEGFGPASAEDVAQFALHKRSTVREALARLGDRVVPLRASGGATLYDVPDGVVPEEDAPAPPRLMAMWDSTLLAYADRSRLIPPALRPLVIRRNGDVLPTVLVDGEVRGVWRPVTPADGEVAVEVTALTTIGREDWDELELEAASLARLLAGREPDAYTRYGRWWTDLPATEVRTLTRAAAR